MRLYSTLTRRKDDLPLAARARSGCTSAARPSTQRAHVGNARPFVIGMWLRSWLKETRLRGDARPQHHRRQRQDLRRRAPDGERRARRAGDRAGTSRTRTASGSACPTRAERDRDVPEIVALIEELIERGHAYEVEGDVYFRVASFPDYGELSGQRTSTTWSRSRSRTTRRRTRATSRSGRRTKEGEDTSWDSPWGRGRPGWHIECSAMAEKLLGPAFEIHGGGLDLVFPHHENELAQSRALGHEFARIWAHNGMLAVHRREDVEVGRQRRHAPRGARPLGPRGAAALLPRRPLAQADRLLRRDDGAGAGAGGDVPQRLRRSRASGDAPERGTSFADALEDDFNTPEALAVLHDWRANGQLDAAARGARALRARVARRAARRRPEVVALAESAPGGAGARRLRGGRPAARRDRARPAGRCATRAERLPARPEARDARELVYGRRAVREALRGRREVLELWATERALAAEPWLARGRRARPGEAGARADRARAARATTRASSRASSRTATPTPTSSPPASGRCSSASTRSPTRATSARSAAAPRARARPASSSRRTARRA